MKKYPIVLFGLALATLALAQQGVTTPQSESRPRGFRFFNQHLTIKPYVSLSYTYDTNIDTTRHATDDSIFAVNPGSDFEWRGERWMLVGSLWYRYRYFCEYNSKLGENSYGENLKYVYSTSKQNEKGWTLMLSQRYAFLNQSDNLNGGDGRGLWRDRERLDVSGVLERRFTERWHVDVQGQYNWLDYKNGVDRYVPLYGYTQYSAGIQAGYAASKWTDLLVAAGYSHYDQDDIGYFGKQGYDNKSDSWSLQAGFGSRATELIQYRALMGASWLDYSGGSDCGWTYSLSGNWRIHRQVQLSVLGSSYYQPSERYFGQSMKVYNLSGGISYLTLGDRMRLTGNVAWRFEDNLFSDGYYTKRQSYDENLVMIRLGADYLVNRWMSVFANVIWEENWCDNDNDEYNYNRFRGTVGVRLQY